MSMSDIRIHRDFNIVRDFVQVPPNREVDKTRVSADRAMDTIQGSQALALSLGSGNCTGSKFGVQRLLRLPPLRPGETYLSRYGFDPQRDLSWTHDNGPAPTTISS